MSISNESIFKITVEGKKITIFKTEYKIASDCESENISDNSVPLVILHEYGEISAYNPLGVWNKCKMLKTNPFNLAVIPESNSEWNNEMSPWEIPAISKGDTPCSGKAEQYLEKLTQKIIPAIENELNRKPGYIALAGYSLAGLFAVYAMYKTDIFDRIASASGSFWYPNFVEFIKNNSIKRVPEKIYLSLGDKECKAREKILQSVQRNTEEIYKCFLNQKINTIFELNEGNHFQKTTERTAKGIKWILENM